MIHTSSNKNAMLARLLSLLMAAALLHMPLFSQEPLKTGTTAASFLELGIGARAVSMGEAYVAVAEGVSSAYWNPAGLGRLERTEASFMQMEYVAGMELQNAAFALPVPSLFTLGFMVTNLAVPVDKVRTVEDPLGLSGETFDAGSMALTALISRTFTDAFDVGMGLKYINERIHVESASALAFDFGVLIKTGMLNNMRLGMSVTNFGGKMHFTGEDLFRQIPDREDILGTNQNLPANFETGYWPLPVMFRIGVATHVINRDKQRLLVSVEGTHPNNTSEYVNIGGEFINSLGKFGEIALRGGYSSAFQADSQQGVTLGCGLDIFVRQNFGLVFDYAYSEYQYFGDVHRYSLKFKL